MNDERDLIAEYIDKLLGMLRVDPRRTRRILVESEDHLRETAERLIEQGATPAQAQATAIEQFGRPDVVARRFAAEEGRLLPPPLLLDLVLSLGLLFGIGMAAIGVSGALAAGMGTAFGQSFISGDPPEVTYTPARCAYLMADQPGSRDCEAAATAHHYGEVVGYRAVAGVLGLLVLGGWLVIRQRYPRFSGVRILPEGFVPTVGAALFGVAALLLLLQGTGSVAAGRNEGAGGYLSGGIVSLGVFAAFAVPLFRLLVSHRKTSAEIDEG